MRIAPFILALLSSAALACSAPSCAGSPCGQKGGPLVETITYALEEVGAADNSDIKTAVRIYQKEMRALTPKVPEEAFVGGHFNPSAYIAYSPSAKALEAQIDLFETIYMVLNDAQKEQFPKLMGMYQHHMKFASKENSCGCHGGCKCGGSCGKGMGLGMGCGPKGCSDAPRSCGGPNCAPAPQKKTAPLKR